MLLVAALLVATPPFLGPDLWAGCVVEQLKPGVLRADCLGTAIVELRPAKTGGGAALLQTTVAGEKTAGFTDLDVPGWVSTHEKALALTTTTAPTTLATLQKDGEVQFIGLWGDRVIACSDDEDDVVTACSWRIEQLLKAAPEEGTHPTFILGQRLSLSSTCTWEEQPVAHLSCAGSNLYLLDEHAPAEPWFGFGFVAAHAVDVPCRFLGGETTCRAVRDWPADFNKRRPKPSTFLRSRLSVWLVRRGIRVICTSPTPTVSDFCANFFPEVALADNAAAPIGLQSPAALEPPADPLAGCRRSSTDDADVALCDGDTFVLWRLRADDADAWRAQMIKDILHFAPKKEYGTETLRVLESSEAETLYFSTGHNRLNKVARFFDGRAFFCDVRGEDWAERLRTCIPRMEALAIADGRPPLHEIDGVRFGVPAGCQQTLPNAIVCPNVGSVMLEKGTTPVEPSKALLFIPEAKEQPCTVFGVDKTCTISVSKNDKAALTVFRGNGPTHTVTCMSALPDGQIPPVCAPFLQLR